MPGDVNTKFYDRDDIVRFYANLKELELPEITILNVIKAELSQMKMLDIGVGGGRTASHFANLVKEYVGIDSSNKMIDICNKQYSTVDKRVRFELCDARHMDIFPDNLFDFVLFSATGIDYVNHEDRLKIFKEVRRVCRDGSLFCFSAHNILSVKRLFRFKIYNNIMKTFKKAVKYVLFRIYNDRYHDIIQREHAIVSELEHRYILKAYYTNPNYQMHQLNEFGFNNIRVFSSEDGQEIVNDLSTREDYWLYYLCNVNKH